MLFSIKVFNWIFLWSLKNNWELIIIENGLGKNIKLIIEEYLNADVRIKLYSITKTLDKAAKNLAIGYSSGIFLNFLNVGYTLFPYSLEIFARNISLLNINFALNRRNRSPQEGLVLPASQTLLVLNHYLKH